jgi:hypothetical protein
MLEDPIMAVNRILPWVVCTHIKDGGILLAQEGLVTFPSEIGKGVVNICSIADKISSLKADVNFTIEDHGGSFVLPVFDPLFLSKFPDLTAQEYSILIKLSTLAAGKVQSGELKITEREKWPDICESRIQKDIYTLKEIIN